MTQRTSMGLSMRRLEFVAPTGTVFKDPNPELLKAVFSNESSYWKGGALDAGLHFKSLDGSALMDFTFHPDRGFCVVYESKRADRPLVLSTDPAASEKVSVSYIHERVWMPLSHFVPAELALQAAVSFLPDGKALQAPGAHWIAFEPEDC